ncbi:TonB-dependent receptor [Sphingomonas sp. HMP9]|uniref:TonB-dependent receptor n=1 Tax=Sphingomonas sp. HMP9 TaxID=1517554 RepID=UPI001596983C|nr:TonB-dependent receptor [Sphingomonas sp. HMP9]
MTKSSNGLRGGAALQALALMGAGLAATMALAAPAVAQDFTNGAMVGVVNTPEGTRVSGGTVTVVSNAQGFTRTAQVSADGAFRVPALPVGSYSVTVASPGFQSLIDRNVSVVAGSSATYTFTLTAIAAGTPAGGDEIVVTGRAVRGNDFSTNTGGLAIGNVSDLLNSTPIARNQTALILLAPGATAGDTAFGDGNLPSLSGATVAENQYYVNGLNVTNFRNFVGSQNPPIEFYQSFDTKTFGLSAEYGRALGGFTTTVTKSGSNTLKAGAIVAFSPDGLRDDSPNTYAAYNQTDYVDNVEANFYLSGPIIKDRLFFYGLYNPNYSKTQNSSITLGQRLTETNSSPFFGGKIDAIITDGHRLEGTYFRNAQTKRTRYDAFNGTTGAVGAPIGDIIEKSGGDNFVGSYTGQFSKWLTLSAAYGENHDDRSFTPLPVQSLIQSTLTGTTTTARGFDSGLSTDEDVRKFMRADGDIYVNLLGSHHFRFGYEQEKLTSTTDTRYAGGYRYLLAPTYVYRYNYVNEGTWKSKNESYYIQDNWSLINDRLTLQLGLRNDRFSNDTLEGTTFNKSGNQWGPRLGAAFDVFGDKRTTIRGSWSRYFLPVATNTNIRLGGAELYYRQRFAYPTGVNPAVFDANGLPAGLTYDALGNIVGLGVTTGGVAGACPAVAGADAGANCSAVYSDGVLGPTDTLVSSTLKPSYTDEWTIGAQQRLGDWTFGLTYINRRLGRTLDDVAIDAAVLSYCDREGINGCGDVFSGFHQYVLANPGQDIQVRLDGDCTADPRQCEVANLSAADLGFPKAVRKYDSVQFEFEKAPSNGWYLRGSYTYTKLRGNYEGAVKSDNGQDDAGLTQDFDQPGLLDGATGVLANGRAHAFKLFGSYRLTKDISIGANMLFESPRKFSCIGQHYDSDNFAYQYDNASYYCTQPQFADRPSFVDPTDPTRTSYLVDRSTAFKSQWRKQIDINVQYDIAALPGSFMSVDVFNVFNFKSKLDYNEFGNNAGGSLNERYAQVTGYQAPRSVRLTLGLRFGEPARGE